MVADEGEDVAVRSDESGQHAHGGAGVAAVEWLGRLDEGASGAGDVDGFVVIVDDLCAEGLHAGERGVGIGAGGEVGEAGGAFGEAGEQGVTVRDGLVSGESDGALQSAGRTNGLSGHATSILFELLGSGLVRVRKWNDAARDGVDDRDGNGVTVIRGIKG